MKTLDIIYRNRLGSSYEFLTENQQSNAVAMEILSISFLINHKELENFVESIQKIINYHTNCTCPRDLENKMVIYQAKQMEIRMTLSFDQLILLKDLLKGTHFRLGMESVLRKYKID